MGGKLVYILDAEGIFDQMDITSTCSGSSMAQVQLPGSRESARIKLAYSFALSFHTNTFTLFQYGNTWELSSFYSCCISNECQENISLLYLTILIGQFPPIGTVS
jgi:hypothetical protein